MVPSSLKAVDRHRLHGIGGFDGTTYLRNKAVAQQSGTKANHTGRIVLRTLKRCDLQAERIAALITSGFLAGKRAGMPHYAVEFREEHPTAEHAEDYSGTPFALRTKPTSHTCPKNAPRGGTSQAV
jgi:hypothetical protein